MKNQIWTIGGSYAIALDSYIVKERMFNKPDKENYEDWVKLIYNVENNTTETQLFFIGQGFDIASVSEMAVLENKGTKAVREPVKVTPSLTYQFSTTGTHTVYVKFADKTVIPNDAFFKCTELKEVIIPNTVTWIGIGAFTECEGLTSIIIPDSVTEIGIYAFQRCTGLTSVTIPNSVQTIEEYAFGQCTGLESVTIGSAVTTIGANAFAMCKKLWIITSLAITAPSIQEYTFYNVGRWGGILYVPAGATGYDEWLSGLPSGWTVQTISE